MGTASLKYGAPVNHVHIGSNVYHLSDDYVLEQLCSDCALSESISDKKESMKMMVQFDEQEKLFRVKSLTDSVELEVADTQNSSAGIDEVCCGHVLVTCNYWVVDDVNAIPQIRWNFELANLCSSR